MPKPHPRLLSFQTRARTIDHLGRTQIADAPTAVSELWKNAYDAYARNVALHVFDGERPVAAILDDGSGMNRDDFEQRWLVIGTETKFGGADTIDDDRLGLPLRPRQGEKGIGRLSAAFLSPINIVIGKKIGQPFAAVAVDWRLFENPFLTLSDIRLPVIEFHTRDEFLEQMPAIIRSVIENTDGDDGPTDRRERINAAWTRYDAEEKKSGRQGTTRLAIRKSEKCYALDDRHLTEWHPFVGLSDHGTAIYMLQLHRELSMWVDRRLDAEAEAEKVREALRMTLTGFTDPFAEPAVQFGYEVLIHNGAKQRREIGSTEVFGVRQLRSLEHLIEGRFDRKGIFHGTVRAFGKELGEFTHEPASPLPSIGSESIGPFAFCIGTFEQQPLSSTHTPADHAQLGMQAENHAGLAVYRDGLRVMPYGRPDSDFFELEERRSRHAGREFWAHRRVFGRVAFTKRENPNLKDKAGREGLVDNSARRWLRMLVKDLLMNVARRYFGTDSDVRQSEAERIKADNRKAAAAAEEARRHGKAEVRKFIEAKPQQFTQLATALAKIDKEIDADKKGRKILELEQKLGRAETIRSELELNIPPALPPNAADMEPALRKLKRQHDALTADVVETIKAITRALQSLETDGKRLLQGSATAAEKRYHGELESEATRAVKVLEQLKKKLDQRKKADEGEYARLTAPLIADIGLGSNVSDVQIQIDEVETRLRRDIVGYYRNIVRAAELLLKEIDLEGALRFADMERDRQMREIERFHGLAQTGVSVEVIGHELDTLEQEVGRNLELLAKIVGTNKHFKAACDAHRALVNRLKFLSPLKLAGFHPPEDISGDAIADFVRGIFQRRFTEHNVDFVVTPAFSKLVLHEQPARIYPVFINLVSNALHWVASAEKRVIRFDYIKGKVLVSDSGAGIDPSDIDQLFTLFFTRRPGGRGVGLYLCRTNLNAGGHRIHYAGPDDPKPERGANFVIEFQGLIHAEK
jgi:signal transduction histidine kinase